MALPHPLTSQKVKLVPVDIRCGNSRPAKFVHFYFYEVSAGEVLLSPAVILLFNRCETLPSEFQVLRGVLSMGVRRSHACNQRDAEQRQNAGVDPDVEPHAEARGERRFGHQPHDDPEQQRLRQLSIISPKRNSPDEEERRSPSHHDGAVDRTLPRHQHVPLDGKDVQAENNEHHAPHDQ